MTLLCYFPATSNGGHHLQKAVAWCAQGQVKEIYDSWEAFCLRLRAPSAEPSLVVLMASDQEDLRHMADERDLLTNHPLVLVLPDKSSASVATGHLLRPRFLAFPDVKLSELTAVIGRIAAKLGWPGDHPY